MGTLEADDELLLADLFAKMPFVLLDASNVGNTAKLLYAHLYKYALGRGHNSTCYPGHRRLMQDLGYTSRTVVYHAMKELVAVGLVEVTRRGRMLSNIYRLRHWKNADLTCRVYSSREESDVHSGEHHSDQGVSDVHPGERHPQSDVHGGEHKVDLVVVRGDEEVSLLVGLGIQREVAERLAESFEADYIRSKVDLLERALEIAPSGVGNSAGWLRKAIEEDYTLPPDYTPVEAPRRQSAQGRPRRKSPEEWAEEAERIAEAQDRQRRAMARFAAERGVAS